MTRLRELRSALVGGAARQPARRRLGASRRKLTRHAIRLFSFLFFSFFSVWKVGVGCGGRDGETRLARSIGETQAGWETGRETGREGRTDGRTQREWGGRGGDSEPGSRAPLLFFSTYALGRPPRVSKRVEAHAAEVSVTVLQSPIATRRQGTRATVGQRNAEMSTSPLANRRFCACARKRVVRTRANAAATPPRRHLSQRLAWSPSVAPAPCTHSCIRARIRGRHAAGEIAAGAGRAGAAGAGGQGRRDQCRTDHDCDSFELRTRWLRSGRACLALSSAVGLA